MAGSCDERNRGSHLWLVAAARSQGLAASTRLDHCGRAEAEWWCVRYAHFSAALIPEYDFPGLIPVFLRRLAGGSILNQWLRASSVDLIPRHAWAWRSGSMGPDPKNRAGK